jgi:FdhE protein
VELNRAICGDDPQCRGELEKLPSFLKQLDHIAQKLDFGPVGESPFFAHVDLRRARDVAHRYVPEEFVDYIIRRSLFFRYGGGEDGGRCRVCGVPASLVVLRREDAGIFEGYRAYARCVCGSTWPSMPWRCPNCGVEGRENFEVYLLKEGRLLRCVRCGYLFGEVEELGELQALHVKFLLLITKIS